MTPCETEVLAYLQRAGAAEIDSMRLDLDRRWTAGQLRAALKAIGAEAYRTGNRWTCAVRPAEGVYIDRWKTTRRTFTIYRIPRKPS